MSLHSPIPYVRGIGKFHIEGEQKPSQDKPYLCIRQSLTNTAMAAQSKWLERGSIVLGEILRRCRRQEFSPGLIHPDDESSGASEMQGID
jgi:hypothetical protein